MIPNTRKFLLSLVLFTMGFSAMAQIVNIPDVNFKQALIDEGVDTNGDGEIEVNEAVLVVELLIKLKNVQDFTGIKSFTNLEYFACDNNDPVELDVSGLENLRELHLLSCLNLTNINLNNLNSLEFLRITTLSSLQNIDISELPSLNRIVIEHSALVNNLIPNGVPNLSEMYCAYNPKLETVDLSSCPALDQLECRNNSIKFLNLANGSVLSSANLILDSLNFLCLDNIDEKNWFINTFPSIQTFISTNCNFTHGGNFYTLEGKVRFDEQGDCDGIDEIEISDLLFFRVIEGGNELGVIGPGFTSDLEYKLNLPAGNYDIVPIFDSDHVDVTPSSFNLVLPGSSNPVIQDICVSPKGAPIVDVEVKIIPLGIPRAGFETDYKVIFSNQGNAISSGIVHLNYQDPLVQFVDATLPVNDNGTQVSHEYIDLMPFERRAFIVSLKLNSPMDTPPLNAGDEILISAIGNPNEDDFNLLDNHVDVREEVINSYDPNDKRCLTGDFLPETVSGKFINYLIRFENTGTGDAVNITVRDSIDSELFFPSSIRVIDASHDVYMQQQGEVVEFIFEDIYLPFDDANNDGYVAFRIQTKDDLVIGDSLLNNADIFFDFNWPIRTNTATSIIVTDMDGDGYHNLEDCDDNNPDINPIAIEIPNNDIDENCDGILTTSNNELLSEKFIIYPNPASGKIYANVDFNGPAILRSIDGREVFNAYMQNGKLDISAIAPGFYILELLDSDSSEVFLKRMVIE